MRNKLKELQELRDRAGIKFDKSFRCKDAEKNIHLLDVDTFFKKIKERLSSMGYDFSDDFDFYVVMRKFEYAERHHVGRSYSWKYFYSSTFEITQELVDYLLRHNFIFPKEEKKKESKSLSKKGSKKSSKVKSKEELIEEYEERAERYKQHINNFNEKIKYYSLLNDKDFLRNYRSAKRNAEQVLVDTLKKLEALKQDDKTFNGEDSTQG